MQTADPGVNMVPGPGKILVTGATGFIGMHLIAQLAGRGIEVVAAGRNPLKLEKIRKQYGIETVCFDIYAKDKIELPEKTNFQTVIHLAWGKLDQYNSLSHIEDELPAHLVFLKRLVLSGVKRILVSGTCFEYGMQNGMLDERQTACPVTCYAVAKDTLRKYLEALGKSHSFSLVWLRYFYLFGKGQGPRTLISQLNEAIKNKDEFFPMSGGEQLRDFLFVEDAALITRLLALHPTAKGIFNICSGAPVSVRNLVEQRIARTNSSIKLDLGHYPYPEYEPMAFWGSNHKTKKITGYGSPL